jgi:hypothetical protein
MSLWKIWLAAFLFPFVAVAKARLLVWFVGLPWDFGHARTTLAVATVISGIASLTATIYTLIRIEEKRGKP